MKKLLKPFGDSGKSVKATNKNQKLLHSINLDDRQILDASQIALGQVLVETGSNHMGPRAAPRDVVPRPSWSH